MMVLHVKLCKRMYDSISGGWCEDNNASFCVGTENDGWAPENT